MDQPVRWEYCRLYFKDTYHNIHDDSYGYDVQIWFMNSQGSIDQRQGACRDQALPFDPWLKAFGLLGGAAGSWSPAKSAVRPAAMTPCCSKTRWLISNVQ